MSGIFDRPVIAVRGLSGPGGANSSQFALFRPHTPLGRENSGFRFNWGTNTTENAHFRKEKGKAWVPSPVGYRIDFRDWRPSVVCSPYKCLHDP